jgi:exoribonuclease R
MIPAILLLEKNKTYGKVKDKYLYRCKRVTSLGESDNDVLVPYKLKIIGYQKFQPNKYVLIEITDTTQKHPMGRIVHTLGNVDDLGAFYEFNLYAKELNTTSKFNSFVKQHCHPLAMQREFTEKAILFCKDDRTNYKEVISIDPEGSKDIDDAFSITDLPTGDVTLSIYIANVALWLHVISRTTSRSVWKYIERVTTVYLPPPKGPQGMLPRLLSDNLCSLLENQTRAAFVCDITIDPVSKKIRDVKFTNASIVVQKNYSYDDPLLKECKTYTRAKVLITSINNDDNASFDGNETRFLESIDDSHDVIAWMMIAMNYFAAKEMKKTETTGLYRHLKLSTPSTRNTPGRIEISNANVKRFLKGWNSTGASYTTTPSGHDILNLPLYTHITSPIRRLVDLINSCALQLKLDLLKPTQDCLQFLKRWLLDSGETEINQKTKATRKVQIHCNLLHLVHSDPETLERTYEGTVIDTFGDGDSNGDLSKKYVVLLHELNHVGIYKTQREASLYRTYTFTLYHFKNKANFKQKILIKQVT